MNRSQKIVIDSLKKAYDEGQNIFRRPSMQTAFGVINTQAEQLTAAQARITELETVCRAAEKELRIASELPDLSPRNRVEFSNAANMLLSILQETL